MKTFIQLQETKHTEMYGVDDVGSVNIEWYDDEPEAGYITALNIDEFIRNKGYGTIFMEDALQICREHKFKCVLLKVLKDSWMHKWYESYGFKDYVEEDEYMWMKKNL